MSLETADLEYVRTLVHRRSALVLDDDKSYLVESRLLNVARRSGCGSVADLIARLRREIVGVLHSQVVEAMTTNETSFYRDVQPFEALRKVILPDLIKNRAAERTLNIWCAASSTGQEPYSLAMLIREYFPAVKDWRIQITASDLSSEVLERAREARYSQHEVNRGLPATMLVKYFQKQGADWVIKDDVRRMIDFKQVNLIERWPTFPPLDIVLIRNVMIYFDVPTKKRILGQIRQLLRPDGYLFLGGAETTLNLDESYTRLPLERAGCYKLVGR